MSLFINAGQYATLESLRGNLNRAVSNNDAVETQRSIGLLQGFLIGLHAAGEIDAGDVQSLEVESFQHMDFLLNARRASHAH